MPIDYSYDSEAKILHALCTGELTFEQVGNYFTTIEKDESIGKDITELINFKAVTDFNVSSANISDLPKLYEYAKNKKQINKTILICEKDLHFGIARMIRAFFEIDLPDHQLLPVRSEEEAYRVLGNSHN